jgi:hypothetical protein
MMSDIDLLLVMVFLTPALAYFIGAIITFVQKKLARQ